MVKKVFEKGGWIWSEHKSKKSSQMGIYPGFIVDSKLLLFKIFINKLKKVNDLVVKLKEQKKVWVHFKNVAKVMGSLIS